MVIESAQNHLGLPRENAIQLSYCVAFPLATWADLSRMSLPVSIKTMARPPVALGTGGMAAAIVVAPQVAKLIEELFKKLLT